jgi:hypothetical protein
LLVYFLIERFPQSSFPLWANVVLGLFVPRILILIFIYQNMGYENIWFAAHLAALILTYFTGGTRSVRWRRSRRVKDGV